MGKNKRTSEEGRKKMTRDRRLPADNGGCFVGDASEGGKEKRRKKKRGAALIHAFLPRRAGGGGGKKFQSREKGTGLERPTTDRRACWRRKRETKGGPFLSTRLPVSPERSRRKGKSSRLLCAGPESSRGGREEGDRGPLEVCQPLRVGAGGMSGRKRG